MNIRGKFVGMRKPGTALHTPYNRPTATPFCALRRGEFIVVDGKVISVVKDKVVVVPPKTV